MCKREHISPIGPLSPALLVGIIDPKKTAVLNHHALACAAEPNLQAIIADCTLQQAQGSATPVPPWLFIFGLYFHYDSLTIFAHIPRDNVCHTVLVDTLPFPRNLPSAEDLFLRLQAVVALRTIRNHLVKLCSFFKPETIWPLKFTSFEASIIHKMTGIYTPAPSERSHDELTMSMVFDFDEVYYEDDEEAKQTVEAEREAGQIRSKEWLKHKLVEPDEFEDPYEGRDVPGGGGHSGEQVSYEPDSPFLEF